MILRFLRMRWIARRDESSSISPLSIFLILAMWSIPVSAQDREPRILWYDTPWLLDETLEDGEPVWVEEESVLVSMTLRPLRLFQSPVDVTDDRGRPLLPAGTQLVFGTAADREVGACTIQRTSSRDYRSGRRHICLIDRDNDGLFEFWFERGMQSNWHFAPNRQSGRLRPLEAVALEEIDPDELTESPILSLIHVGILEQDGIIGNLTASGGTPRPDKAYFYLEVAFDGEEAVFHRGCPRRAGSSWCPTLSLPRSAEMSGFAFDILEQDGERLLIQMTELPGPTRFEFSNYIGNADTGVFEAIELGGK